MSSTYDSADELEPQAAEFNLEEVYEEIKNRALDEGLRTRDDWDGLVEEVLQIKLDRLEIRDDDYMENLESLKSRYDDFRLEIPDAV